MNFDRKEKILYLSRYAQIKDRILILLERKKAYQDSIYGIKSPNLDGMPHGGVRSDISDKVIRCISVTNDIDAEMTLLCEKLERIKAVVSKLNDYNERSIIEMKYIDGLSYKHIKTMTDVSMKTIQRRLTNALIHLDMTNDDFKDAMD